MSDLGKRLLIALGLTAAADALLLVASPGIGLTCFAALVAVVLIAFHGQRLLRAGPWLALWMVLALNTAWVSSVIGTLLLIALSWIVLAFSRMNEPPVFFMGAVRGFTGGARSFTMLGSDVRRWVLITGRLATAANKQGGGLASVLPPFWVYALPIALVAVFAILIIPANLVLGQWVEGAFRFLWQSATDLLKSLQFSRAFFWLAIAVGVYGLIRFRLGRHPAHRSKRLFKRPATGLFHAYAFSGEADNPPTDPSHERRACMLTFIGLNGLYLLANLADLFYIWLHAQLPAGMTYAEFAHHGSYRLILAVVLAAILVPAFFRNAALAAKTPRARLLAYSFIVQNLIVLLGAARRLMLYDEVYGLTRLRLATFLWLALVFAGFVITFIKVYRNKPFLYLVRANAVSTVLLLSAVGWLNLDGLIADWNVERYLSGQTKIMDVHYLGQLDAAALPALARLTGAVDSAVATEARRVLWRRRQEEKSRVADWRTWTWQGARALKQVDGIPPGNSPQAFAANR